MTKKLEMRLVLLIGSAVLSLVTAQDEDGGEGEDDDEEAMVTPESDVLKKIISTLVIICFVICIGMFVQSWYKRTFREKMDIISVLGLCLAQISNEEDRNPNNIILNGIGLDDENIAQWTQDIWETYDFNDDGNIDKREIKKFVDQTFEKVGLKYEYNEFDLDDFFSKIDVTQDGMVSKAELKNFFRKLGNTPPDEELRDKLGLYRGIPPLESERKTNSEQALDSDRKGLVRNEEA